MTTQIQAVTPDGTVTVDGLRGRRVPLFVRIRAELPAVLIDLTYGHAVHGRVENLSVGGIFFRGADTLGEGARVLCALIVTKDGRTEEVYASGSVVHRHDHGVGVAFDEVTPRAFAVISEMIAEAGCFRMRPIEPRCPAAAESVPAGDRRGERKRPRPRKARLTRWMRARQAV